MPTMNRQQAVETIEAVAAAVEHGTSVRSDALLLREALAALRDEAGAEAELPCDVLVAPATTICAGCKVSTLLSCIDQRRDEGAPYRLTRPAPQHEVERLRNAKVFPINVMGGPMREFAPGQWENAVWPSDCKPEGGVTEAMVGAAAEALWVSCSTRHKLLAKAGYATDWASQPAIIKRDYHKQARAALEAALAHQKGTDHEG